ncbi:MAG: hypothetical protein GY752_02535 [bacterium]|nr:hypothetical protein [bacterium]MCP4799388.1 hypothetical protein [bacterium]
MLNEVMYDPAGADAGKEFIELYNSGSEPLSLLGVQVAFANGANGPDWQTRWVGSEHHSIEAGGFFLIADTGWDGNADAIANLDLQNGPDGIMLTREGTYLDLLGYGPLQHEGLCEEIPHPGSGSGKSIGRKPDGNDTDVNSLDWFILEEPNPGSENFRQFSIASVDLEHWPPVLLIGSGTVVSKITLFNDGLQNISSTNIQINADGVEVGSTYITEIESGSSADVYLTWSISHAGSYEIELTFSNSEISAINLGVYQSGLLGLVLSEVMAAPGAESCEWIEVENYTDEVMDLSGYRIKDADNESQPIPNVSIYPNQKIIIAQSADVFTQWWLSEQQNGAWPDCSMPVLVELDGSWPTINNSAPDDRNYADYICLMLPERVVIDWLHLGDSWPIPAARSVERVNREPIGDPSWNWRPSTATARSTPGCSNSVSGGPVVHSAVIAKPNPVTDGVQHISFFVSPPATGWQARIFNLSGKCVRELGGDQLGEGPRDIFWQGNDDSGKQLSSGGYILLVQQVNDSNELLWSDKLLLAIDYGAIR